MPSGGTGNFFLLKLILTLKVKVPPPPPPPPGPNLVILAWAGDELCRTNSKWGKFWFQVKFDLEDQGRPLHKTTGILIKIRWSKFGHPNFNGWSVIVQTSLRLTDTQTDAGNDNTRRPDWPRVKSQSRSQKQSSSAIQPFRRSRT